jgi:hypothetical protein
MKEINSSYMGTVADFTKLKHENTFDISKADDALVVLYLNTSKTDFLMVISSKIMLLNAMQQATISTQPPFFHIDATYKLMSSGFLLLTLSTEDPCHRGRLIAMAITLHEDTTAYTKFIETVKDALKTHYHFEWKVNYVLSDGADSIHNAIKANFSQTVHLLCFFHLKKAVRRHIQSIKDASVKSVCQSNMAIIFYSIDLLHKTKTQKEYETCWQCIKTHWQHQLKLANVFIDYFEQTYVSSDQKWNFAASFKGG